MAQEKFSDEQAAIVAPIIGKLVTMMGAARDAFNRHSLDRLQEMQGLQKAVREEVDGASKQVRHLIARKPEAEQQIWMRLDAVLNRLEVINANLGALVDPIHKKIKGAVLFSNKAVTQTNYLFDQHAGMIRSVLDVVKTDNSFLKKYLMDEGRNLVRTCADFGTEHQDRLIEGLCTPQAAPIFLGILDTMQTLGQTEMEIAGLLEQKL